MLHRNYVQDIRDAFIELKENDDMRFSPHRCQSWSHAGLSTLVNLVSTPSQPRLPRMWLHTLVSFEVIQGSGHAGSLENLDIYQQNQ